MIAMSDNNQQPGIPPEPSEDYGNVQQPAATFGNMPQAAAPFGNMRQSAERTENHTITVREAARMFEAAGVARIERSIINWCHPNRQGVARLDSYFDENERRYYITPQSIDRAIAEEKAKAERRDEPLPQAAEPSVKSSPASELQPRTDSPNSDPTSDRIKQLEKEVTDLRILEAGKDYWIKQLREERDGFMKQLVEGSRRIGELESELRQLTA